MRISPTTGQQAAMTGIREFMAGNATIFTVDGAAGTGKTTMLDMAREAFPGAIIGAPTNKACDVLRKKGFQPTTLDRIINHTKAHTSYREMTTQEVELYEKENWAMPMGRQIAEVTYEKIEKISPTSPVVIDESSMVSLAQIKQLSRIAPKIICIGDAFQLGPVEGEEWFQGKPHDAVLTEIVRTAEGSGIPRLGQALRNKDCSWREQDYGDAVSMIQVGEFDPMRLAKIDVTLAHKNSTCDLYNSVIRDTKGLSKEPDPYRPVRGDTLLSWYTTHDGTIIKGATYTVVMAAPCNGGYSVQCRELDARGGPIIVKVAKANLMEQCSKISTAGCRHFSYAHCVTAHKSQGSEWDNVLVLAHDYFKRSDPKYWNWAYTAITRAKQHLSVII